MIFRNKMFKRIINSSLYSLLSRIFVTSTNLFFIYFISKNMDKSYLGVYAILFFFYQLFGVLSSINLYQFFGKEFAAVRNDSGKIKNLFEEFTKSHIVGFIISLILLFIFLLLYRKISPTLLLLIFPSGILFGIERNLGGVLLGFEKMRAEFISNLLSFNVIIFSVLLKKDLFLTLKSLILLKIFSQLISIYVKLGPLKKDLVWSVKNLKFRFFIEGKFFWLSGMSAILLRQADIFILSFFIGKSLLGSYFLALRIYYFFGMVAEVFSFALTPFISATYSGKEKESFISFNKRLIKIFTLFAIISSLILLFTKDLLISILAKPDPAASGYLLLFSGLVFFKFISHLTGNILTSIGSQSRKFYIGFSAMLLLISLNMILIPLTGINGALIARSVSEISIFVAFALYVKKIFKNYSLRTR